ncbi:MAG: glycosylhydrolase-like jelly roll fold domain-containing protein, partial [Ferruginibacter sp.]
QENITKDVAVPEGEQKLLWIHRKDKEGHYYFISNQSNDRKEVRLSFRIVGLLPELWNPETGTGFNAPFWEQANGITTIHLNFEAFGSLFVVFRKATVAKPGFTSLQLNGKVVNPFDYFFTKGSEIILRLKEPGDYVLFSGNGRLLKKTQTQKPVVKTLNTDWNVSFEKNRGAPPSAHFDKLISFTEHHAKGIKYFSGKATYRKDFTLATGELSNGKAVFLDVGLVKNVATIIINGKKVRTFWKPPFAIEITPYCKAGKNVLQVEVTNLWPNRLIGDEAERDDLIWGEEVYFTHVTPNRKIGRKLQRIPDWVKQNKERPSKNRVTFTTMDFFDKDDPLLPSGLLGPVKLSIDTIWNVSQ